MQENSIIKQNILKYLEYKGITPYRFYKENDVTRGILTQNNGITEENLLKFVRFAQDISLDWLLTGNGSMLKTETPLEDTSNDVLTPENGVLNTLMTPLLDRIDALTRENERLKIEVETLKTAQNNLNN